MAFTLLREKDAFGWEAAGRLRYAEYAQRHDIASPKYKDYHPLVSESEFLSWYSLAYGEPREDTGVSPKNDVDGGFARKLLEITGTQNA